VSRIVRTTLGYLLNTIILLVVLNVILGFGFFLHDAYKKGKSNPAWDKYTAFHSEIVKLYPSMSQEDVSLLLSETWMRPLVSESIVGFGEAPYQGKFINVTKYGFRQGADQGPWPPVHDGKNLVVFLFGGSTTFGYGVTDDQALGSRLQPLLAKKLGRPVAVYNFGQSKYGSTQERLLFEKLLVAGYKPDMAIFVDGLNDFQFTWGDADFNWTNDVGAGTTWDAGQPTWRNWLRYGIGMLPMSRLADAVRDKWFPPSTRSWFAFNPNRHYSDQGPLLKVIDRYFLNKQMIEAEGKALSIQTLLVWQPVPTYKYDLKYHLFAQQIAQRGFGDFTYMKAGYPLMQEAVTRTPPDDNFLWCADMQKDVHEPLYVDEVHYSPKMTEMVAGCIAGGVR
jgi:hypothetical protein